MKKGVIDKVYDGLGGKQMKKIMDNVYSTMDKKVFYDEDSALMHETDLKQKIYFLIKKGEKDLKPIGYISIELNDFFEYTDWEELAEWWCQKVFGAKFRFCNHKIEVDDGYENILWHHRQWDYKRVKESDIETLLSTSIELDTITKKGCNLAKLDD